ncbi:MAG: hypothetical protein VKL01_05495 [Limnothrix sp.]|nr:hypothetical protein [Limnothrix sp.]
MAIKICWDFKAELYREELEDVSDAIDQVFHGPADQAEDRYLDGRKALDQIAKTIGENHPELIALTAQLIKVRALKSVRTKRDPV